MTKIENDPKLDFHQVLIKPKRSTINSRSKVDLNREFRFKYSSIKWNGVPIIAANMDTTGTFEVYKALKEYNMITALHKFYSLEDYVEMTSNGLDPNYYMVSTGIGEQAFENLSNILNKIPCYWICIDIANGYISDLVDFCAKVRETWPDKIICAGNVVSGDMVQDLVLYGKVDVVKIGIGPGSACTTRLKTGVGMPQLSAILECAEYAHRFDAHIIGDGGITCPGDASKAFGAGADFIMMGGAFAGHEENPGQVQTQSDGTQMKVFYGMSSQMAMNNHYGKMEKYRASEGRELKIPFKGKMENTVLDYLGGIRSTCTYINAKTIKQMSKCTTFVIVSQQVNNVFGA